MDVRRRRRRDKTYFEMRGHNGGQEKKQERKGEQRDSVLSMELEAGFMEAVL